MVKNKYAMLCHHNQYREGKLTKHSKQMFSNSETLS